MSFVWIIKVTKVVTEKPVIPRWEILAESKGSWGNNI